MNAHTKRKAGSFVFIIDNAIFISSYMNVSLWSIAMVFQQLSSRKKLNVCKTPFVSRKWILTGFERLYIETIDKLNINSNDVKQNQTIRDLTYLYIILQRERTQILHLSLYLDDVSFEAKNLTLNH
jgi:hypothetical protein